ncbi:hypothetical protein F3I62_18965 [Pseudomonas sp. R-28-1W-6]|uniref:hypothetical protein n=1 Tax=Pseudomonas sp. R-28-1W-6 TaxID=2650101 RepID=UPI00136530E5|nr:hypothetical protein [Pseudomonas sp. R-28-1W-6]MWV14187.1 hypothetical protein [Pseudomonas sp. R-28-1W-6]
MYNDQIEINEANESDDEFSAYALLSKEERLKHLEFFKALLLAVENKAAKPLEKKKARK